MVQGQDRVACRPDVQTRFVLRPRDWKIPRFAANPMVLGYPFLRFYAGHPIAAAGRNVGTLCIADQTSRTFSSRDIETLAALAAIVERELSLSQKIAT